MKIRPVEAGHRRTHVDAWEAVIALLGVVCLAAVAFMAGADYATKPQVQDCTHVVEEWPA
jgi:hypothetical protein